MPEQPEQPEKPEIMVVLNQFHQVILEKNMKLIKTSGTLVLTAFAVMASQYVLADDTAGWYAGGNMGESSAKIADGRIINGLAASGFTTTGISNDNRDIGFKLFGGYQFNKYFALEGGYFDLGRFGFAATTLPTGRETGNIEVRGLNLDAVGILPFTDKFSAFGRVGADYAEARDSFAGTGAVQVLNPDPMKRQVNYDFGAGLQYAFTDSLAMRAEADRYRINDAVGNQGDINLVSLGLIYRFGKTPPPPAPEPEKCETPAPAPVVVAPPPPPPPPAKVFEKYTLSATDLFAFNSAELRQPQPKLDDIATALNNDQNIHNVRISGYADRIGSAKYIKICQKSVQSPSRIT